MFQERKCDTNFQDSCLERGWERGTLRPKVEFFHNEESLTMLIQEENQEDLELKICRTQHAMRARDLNTKLYY